MVRVTNSLDPDETPRYAASHLDPNCLPSLRGTIRNCMTNKTANCAQKTTVMAEVEKLFNLCDGTNVSALAQRYLSPPDEICQVNRTASKTCKDDAREAGNGFPFTNKTLSDGLEAAKGLKRAFFGCYRIGLQSNTDCTELSWKMTYMHEIVEVFERLYMIGVYLEETDTVDMTNLQNEMDEQQNPLNARDIFDWGLF